MRLFLVLFFLLAGRLWACDGCGCGPGHMYVGVSPQFHRHFLGLRYRFAQYQSYLLTSDGLQLHSTEKFHISEIWARFYPVKKIQVMAFVPFQYHQQWSVEKGYTQLSGIGDASILASTKIFKTGVDSVWTQVKQTLWAGGGIKLPTGKYNSDLQTINFQTGTGSFDFLAQFNYALKYKKWGFNLDANAKFNTANRHKFLFGNKFSSHTYVGFTQKIKQQGILFYSGMLQEFARKDWKGELLRPESGGYLLNYTAGFEFFSPKFGVGFSFQQPVYQNLALGTVRAKQKFAAQVSYFF